MNCAAPGPSFVEVGRAGAPVFGAGRRGAVSISVVLLTDRAERKPTLRNIKWALGTFLTRSAKKGDTVLVFFAGHGVPEVDPRGVERDGLAKYLAPADVDPDDLYSTGLPMDLQNATRCRICCFWIDLIP